MKASTFFGLVLILFLSCSCQQTQLQRGPVTANTVFRNHSDHTDPSSDPSIFSEEAQDQQNSTLNSKKASIKHPSADDKVESTLSGNSDQEKIDQALELCNYAQTMWEEGNLDDALSNLDSAYYLILQLDHLTTAELSQQKEDIRYLISKRILEIYASRQIVVTGRREAIPITLNTHVNREIKLLTGPERSFFIRALERASMFRPYIIQELKKAGLPEEISWLPLIESGFHIRALSSARALGLWQFIPSTGHKFGLNRTYYIDERMDPEKSTRAAIAYLKELHNVFGDWTTSLAAYNCGEYRVLKTIRNQKINYLDNFWDLYQSLPTETARYVPRFLATVHIVSNLDKYGITIPSPQSPIAYKVFEIKKPILLKDIAKEIGVKPSLLTMLNPELRHGVLPPETYKLKIPEQQSDLFLAKLDTIKSTYAPPPRYTYHRVRKGDTLSAIAQKYGTSIQAISRNNNINKSYRIVVGKVLKIPTRNQPGVPGDSTASVSPAPSDAPAYYSVRKGDNLWLIANKFRITTKQIIAQNGLSDTTLHIGQRLRISTAPRHRVASSLKTATYQVRSGDSPFLIAKRHNMTLNRLLSLNRLNKRSKIYPGQTLIVE